MKSIVKDMNGFAKLCSNSEKTWLIIVRNKILEWGNLITTPIIHSVKSSGTWKTG